MEVKPPERKSIMMPAAFSKRCCPLRRDPLRGTHLCDSTPPTRAGICDAHQNSAGVRATSGRSNRGRPRAELTCSPRLSCLLSRA